MLDIGLTQEELREQIIAKAAEKLADDIREESWSDIVRPIREQLLAEGRAAIKAKITEVIDPLVAENIDALVLQETNAWGEKIGQPQTFKEFVVGRAEAYLREPVNYEGKSQTEAGGYSWSKSQARLAHMIDKHLHYRISDALKGSLDTVLKAVVPSLTETVKIKLGEIQQGLQIAVKPK